MPETNTETNTPEALRQECREALIKGITGYMPFILDEHTEMEDLHVLRDILDYAHMHGNSILTGVGRALSRDRADAIWVRPEHKAAVNRYAAMLEEADDAQSTDADTLRAAKYRTALQEWIDSWESCRLGQLQEFGVVITRAGGCTTPVEEFICGIVREYAHYDQDGEGLSFKSIESLLDEAKDDFTDVVATARYITKRYPEAMIDAEVAAHA